MTRPSISVERIKYLGNQTDDQLLEELGYALFEKDVGATLPRPPKLTELITAAQTWLTEQNEAIAARVCGDMPLRKLVEAESTSRGKIIIAISDIVAVHYTYVPAATFAEILFRKGVSRYCALHWNR